MVIAPQTPRDAIFRTMFTRILRAEIMEKPGRSYFRRPRRGPRKSKGNLRAQYQRRKQRLAEARQLHPD